jgi:hypothetical protein
MKHYRKKPVVIEAIQFDGNNQKDVLKFIGRNIFRIPEDYYLDEIIISTLGGDMKAGIGDWIIKGIKGEFYPCKEEIFLATYEPVEEVCHD